MTLSKQFFSLLLTAVLAFGATGCATHDTSVGTKVDDTMITTKVKTALIGDPDVKGTAVSVETVAGTVQLTGFVDSEAQRMRAEDLARRVEGVSKVDNRLVVGKQ